MNERGKAVEAAAFNMSLLDLNYLGSSEMPCPKHPNSSPVGVCPYCLKERLVKLVCSECGEQRLSSCSCSDVSSSYRNSEVGSVGRVSFLIENDKVIDPRARRVDNRPEQVIFLRRSSSSCVEVKKTRGFWRIKRLFRKKRPAAAKGPAGFCDDKTTEVWVSDIMGVSRSRSLCSFRGAAVVGCNDPDDWSDYGAALSSAKISDVTSGIFLDSERQPGRFSESSSSELGKSGAGGRNYSTVPNWSMFPARESDFNAMDASAFIDLKLDMSEQTITDVEGGEVWKGNNERGHKVWKWIFKYHKKRDSATKP